VVEKVMEVVESNGVEDGLVPIFIYADTGKFMGSNIRLGSRGDSYYGKTSQFQVPHEGKSQSNSLQNISSNNTSKPPVRSRYTVSYGTKH
jgi:hypothetical protein